MNGHLIKEIIRGSIAEELGLEPGDKIIKINDMTLEDVIDYYYLINDEYLEILIKKHNNEEWIVELEKDFDEMLGVEFALPMMNEIKRCQNNCIFCFINQLPPGMRQSLYFKDDDYRLSVFSGNYITLTNLTKKDIKKIIDYRISPLYISVHTTDPNLRQKMLNNEKAKDLSKLLTEFKQAGIEMYGQIVLCPGVNDRRNLEKTLFDLKKLWPQFKNVAIVPVGITNFRGELPVLYPVDKKAAEDTISLVKSFQAECLHDFETSFAFLADEFYLLAGRELPSYEHYEDFTQLENGVGLLRKFENEFYSTLYKLKTDESQKTWKNDKRKLISLVTGKSSEEFIKGLVEEIKYHYGLLDIAVHGITNKFFGEDVTVTGLVTGKDIVDQLYDKPLGKYLLIPSVMMKDSEDVFLDNVTLEELENLLKVRVLKVPVNGKEFIEHLEKL